MKLIRDREMKRMKEQHRENLEVRTDRQKIAYNQRVAVGQYLASPAKDHETVEYGLRALGRMVRSGDMSVQHVGDMMRSPVAELRARNKQIKQETLVEAKAGLNYWYRAMTYEEYSYLEQHKVLHLEPSKLALSSHPLVLAPENRRRRGRHTEVPNIEDVEDKAYIGISTHAAYSRGYMGNRRANNWLVQFHDERGELFDRLHANGRRPTLKGEGGGTFGLGNQGSLPGGVCGEEFNKMLTEGSLDFTLIEARIDLRDLPKLTKQIAAAGSELD